jgi:hypothetical protein
MEGKGREGEIGTVAGAYRELDVDVLPLILQLL